MNVETKDFYELTEHLAAPFKPVTTTKVNTARDRTPEDLWAMLLIDDDGIAEGVARGIWTVA